MGLQLSLYETYGGKQIARWGSQSRSLNFGSNGHGYAALSDFIEMPEIDAWRIYSLAKVPFLVVHDQWHNLAWEGRLERPKIAPGGLEISGFGYWQAMSDVPYTAMWSKTGTAGWREATNDDVTAYTPERYEIDNNNRLYIAPRNGESFNNNTHFGGLTDVAPHAGSRPIVRFSCSYSMLLPANWRFRVVGYNHDFSGSVLHSDTAATGALQSSTLALTGMTARNRVAVFIYNGTGVTSTIAADTGTNFLKLTNVRIQTVDAATVTASAITSALRAYVSAINPGHLAASDALIEAKTDDLLDEIYEDASPADILDYLAGLGSERYEVGVWGNQLLHFRPRSSRSRLWRVAAEDIELERTLDTMANSAYGLYQDGNGRTLRTAVAQDANRVARWGLTRRVPVPASTSSLTAAEAERDKHIAENSEPSVRTALRIRRLQDKYGRSWPLYLAKAGDIVEIKNLQPSWGSEADKIRRFTLAETQYDAQRGELHPVADLILPTLETLVASNAAQTAVSPWQTAVSPWQTAAGGG